MPRNILQPTFGSTQQIKLSEFSFAVITNEQHYISIRQFQTRAPMVTINTDFSSRFLLTSHGIGSNLRILVASLFEDSQSDRKKGYRRPRLAQSEEATEGHEAHVRRNAVDNKCLACLTVS